MTVSILGQSIARNRFTTAFGSMATLVILLISSGCCTSRVSHEGRSYRVDSINLGIVKLDFEHRDRHESGCGSNHSGSCDCSGQGIVSSHTSAVNATVNATKIDPKIDMTGRSQQSSSRSRFESPENDQKQISTRIRSLPISSPVEVQATPQSNVEFNEPRQLEPVEKPTSSRRITQYPTNNSSQFKAPAMAVPFKAPQSVVLPETVVPKFVELETVELDSVAEATSAEPVAENQLDSLAQQLASVEATTSPLRAIAPAFLPPTPLERLASLTPPRVLPSPQDGSSYYSVNQNSQSEQEQVHDLEPMIRLRAIPVLKKIPARPSIALFRDLPNVADDRRLQKPNQELQPPEAIGQARDNWR